MACLTPADRARQRHGAGQDPGELRDGEDEDQVEEELERADPQRLVGGWLGLGHGRAAMSWRYQPPRMEIVAASS